LYSSLAKWRIIYDRPAICLEVKGLMEMVENLSFFVPVLAGVLGVL
jgi:hypothetical protein